MYQAIVFLPLVGAILAGLIALAGARARFPSGMPAPAGHDHGADHHDAHDHARMTMARTTMATTATTAIIRPSRPPPAPARPS